MDGETVSEIGAGLFILVGITNGDTEADAEYLYGPSQIEIVLYYCFLLDLTCFIFF